MMEAVDKGAVNQAFMSVNIYARQAEMRDTSAAPQARRA